LDGSLHFFVEEAPMKRLSILFTLVATAAAFTLGCGGGGNPNPSPGPSYKAVKTAPR